MVYSWARSQRLGEAILTGGDVRIRVAIGLLVFLLASVASAWGNPGHRIICQIAWERLSDEGRDLVIETMALRSFVKDPVGGARTRDC